MKPVEWCWFASLKDAPNGPFATRDLAIADANEQLTKARSRASSFYVAPRLQPDIVACLPDPDTLAGYILEAVDDNCEECFRDPNSLSFALVDGAYVKTLHEVVKTWVKDNVVHKFLVPDIARVQEVSRTTKSK